MLSDEAIVIGNSTPAGLLQFKALEPVSKTVGMHQNEALTSRPPHSLKGTSHV